MNSLSIISEQFLDRLQKGIKVFVGLIAVWLVFTLGACAIDYFGNKISLQSIKATTGEISALEATLKSGQFIRYKPVTKADPIGFIQDLVDQKCVEYKLALSDFQATGELTPFLTRFKKNGNDPGWLQTPIQFQVKGSLASVFELLKSISEAGVPLEFDTFEITNSPIENSGSVQSTVNAKVAFRVLKQEVKA